jgi:Ca-activated chloride channel family protein
MITFAWPWLLLILPLPLLVYWLPKKNNSRISAALIIPQLIDSPSVSVSNQSNKKAPLIILSVCWLLTVIALSQPQWLGDAIDIPTEGREMMIAVDLSGSMQIEDMNQYCKST